MSYMCAGNVHLRDLGRWQADRVHWDVPDSCHLGLQQAKHTFPPRGVLWFQPHVEQLHGVLVAVKHLPFRVILLVKPTTEGLWKSQAVVVPKD